ncbi:MAG: hypothetical protein RBS55_04995 [Bacteroidales bacterium]|jgi:hypothetical protein|nr:hypothetical protein [Bacteroidales bacterium]
MSNHGHHHRSHRRRSALGRFIDRLTGRRRRSAYHRSEFPGIHLPGDKEEGARKYRIPEERSAPDTSPENSATGANETVRQTASTGSSSRRRRKESFFKLYLKKRALRKEERYKEKMRRAHRRRSEKEYRKLNQGPGLGKKLLDLARDEEEAAKKIPLLSNRSRFFRSMTIVVNSMMIFMITYVLTYLFYWLSCMLVASWYGLDSILYFYDLRFNDHSPLWSRFNILLITGIPPFLCLVAGVFLYKAVFNIKRFAGLQKLFILWSAFHLLNHFFGAFPSGVVTDEGLGYVAAWMYMNTAVKFLFSLLFLFGLGLIGYYSAKPILETSDSMGRIKSERKTSFMFYQMGLPWLIGTFVMLLLRIPKNFDYPYETLMFFTMAFLVVPPFFNEKVKPELNLLKTKKKRQINIGYLAMVLVLLAFLRIMLGIGLHFIIEISISISPASI